MNKDKAILWFSIPIASFVFLACFFGVFYSDMTYAREVISYRTQGVGQDLVTLVIVLPMFFVSTYLSYKKKAVATLLWAGCLFYFLYTYLIYSFGLHFNRLFMVYCLIFGLSVYGFLYFLMKYSTRIIVKDVKFFWTSIYLYVISGLFYFIWLSEEIPSLISNTIPKSATVANLMTNPVHTADISLCLPFLILTGILIQKRNNIGYLLAPVALLFSVLLALAIIGMLIVMALNSVEVDSILTVIFAVISIVSIFLLIRVVGKLKNSTSIF